MTGMPGWFPGLGRLGANWVFGAGKDPVSIRYWQSRPILALWPLLGAMALLFSVLAVLGDIASLGRHPLWFVAANALIVATYVVAMFWASIRQRYPVVVIVALAFAGSMFAMDGLAGRVRQPPPEISELAPRMRADTALITVAVAGSYALFIVFLFRESGVLARLRGEVELAALIHARLVSPVETVVHDWECFGRSVASSEMGGDLLDVLPGPEDRPHAWTAYVADVSGHGVGAGLFMGVVKTALRMALRQHPDVGTALTVANAALHDQKRKDMFATLALVRGDEEGILTGCVAGHVPILHWSAETRTVSLVAQQQSHLSASSAPRHSRWSRSRPLAATCWSWCRMGSSRCSIAGVAELGLDAVRQCVQAGGDLALAHLHDRIVGLARAHGRCVMTRLCSGAPTSLSARPAGRSRSAFRPLQVPIAGNASIITELALPTDDC